MVKTEVDCKPGSLDTADQSSFTPPPTELIQFVNNHDPKYQGYCNFDIDSLSKVLNIHPLNKNQNNIISFKASFKWKFLQQKNILFVFGDFDFQDFALIFEDDEKCCRVYDKIFQDRDKDKIDQSLLVKRFLKPIFAKIVESRFPRLKEIMEKWIQKHDENEKQELLTLLKSLEINNGVKQEIDIKIEMDEESAFSETENLHNAMRDDLEEATLTDDEFNCENVEAEISHNVSSSKKQKVFSSEENTKIIDESFFKFVCCKLPKGNRRKLLIFTSAERSHCYEYNFYSSKLFTHKCYRKTNAHKALLKIDEQGNEFIQMEDSPHFCTPKTYDPEIHLEMKIIKKADFKIFENSLTESKQRILIIFDSNDRNQCYEYFWDSTRNKFQCSGCILKRKQMFAEICHKNTEKEYVRLIDNEHVCELRKYEPSNFPENSHHQIVKAKRAGRGRPRLHRVSQQQKRSDSVASSSSSFSRRRGRPRIDNDEGDQKIIRKRIYAREYRQKTQKTHDQLFSCLSDLYKVVTENGIDFSKMFPQHQSIISEINKTL